MPRREAREVTGCVHCLVRPCTKFHNHEQKVKAQRLDAIVTFWIERV
ncbi:hypothetical protein LG3211_4577 [Lysobacter gummosus]|nr:hypothetical protein LG3211_4577 [Lysobacter gummosus]